MVNRLEPGPPLARLVRDLERGRVLGHTGRNVDPHPDTARFRIDFRVGNIDVVVAHAASVLDGLRAVQRELGVGRAGGLCGMYRWHLANAERNAGALTNTPLMDIVSPFDCWANDLTP